MNNNMPIRIQIKRTKYWRMPANTIRVSRPSQWGNPWKISEYGRAGAIDKFREWINTLDADVIALYQQELRGKNLACWCPIKLACHADLLLELMNRPKINTEIGLGDCIGGLGDEKNDAEGFL